MYKPLGYTAVPEGQYIPKIASAIVSRYANLEQTMSEVVDGINKSKMFLSELSLPDLLRASSAAVSTGTEEHKNIVIFLIKLLNKAGYLKQDVTKITYNEDPIISAADAVGNMLTEKIPWFKKEHFGGDRAGLTALKTVLPIALREIKAVERLRPEYYQRLRNYLGHVGYKMLRGQPIDQSEKTFFLNYINTIDGAPGSALNISTIRGEDVPKGGYVPIPPKETGDALTLEAWSLLQKVTLSGPGIRFYRLISNQNKESLVYYYGPLARTLPLTRGYAEPIGPFWKLKLTRFEDRQWSEDDQLTGIYDRFTELPTLLEMKEANGGVPTSAQLVTSMTTWKMNVPFRVSGPRGTSKAPYFIDLPNVTLRLNSETDCSKYIFSYPSPWRQRMMYSDVGGSPDSMYLDLALENKSIGEGAVDKLNIDEFSIVDYDKKVADRKIVREDGQIYERIYYVEKGNVLTSKDVRMTEFMSEGGVLSWRPAYAEYYLPKHADYWKEDPRAVEWIAGQLGLNNDEAQKNALAITVSHNAAMLERLSTAAPPFDLEKAIAVLLNAQVKPKEEVK